MVSSTSNASPQKCSFLYVPPANPSPLLSSKVPVSFSQAGYWLLSQSPSTCCSVESLPSSLELRSIMRRLLYLRCRALLTTPFSLPHFLLRISSLQHLGEVNGNALISNDYIGLHCRKILKSAANSPSHLYFSGSKKPADKTKQHKNPCGWHGGRATQLSSSVICSFAPLPGPGGKQPWAKQSASTCVPASATRFIQ